MTIMLNNITSSVIHRKFIDLHKWSFMGLKMRITYQDTDYVFEIIDGKSINKYTTEFSILFNGEQFTITKNEKNIWVLAGDQTALSANFVLAIGRSVSLRYRM